MIKNKVILPLACIATVFSSTVTADCKAIAAAGNLQETAKTVVDAQDSGGFKLQMWVTSVDETGKVCEVVNSSGTEKDENGRSNVSWLGSRVISAQKANTANAFSLDGFSISTANLYGLTQPGGSLYGLQHSNPVDAGRAYAGSPSTYGTKKDPLIKKRIGGVNVFGGGLALYQNGKKIGAIGVSGDTSCTDHAVAWKIRKALELDAVPAGFKTGAAEGAKGDEMTLVTTVTPNTTDHPSCVSSPAGLDNGVIPVL
ncbi:GlcG/HbpS family heme-binding protein [Methylomonas rhizoryzae]|uniref:GlcG/HbpS family heme-binding protein n=1 Tax=Methylomonas rhizoryzae TaxID=2608981 RepID=UPI001231E8DA|nr:heme-binding protein [Methylomonas rhizoryzae]